MKSYPVVWGLQFYNHYKDPYQTSSISWKVRGALFLVAHMRNPSASHWTWQFLTLQLVQMAASLSTAPFWKVLDEGTSHWNGNTVTLLYVYINTHFIYIIISIPCYIYSTVYMKRYDILWFCYGWEEREKTHCFLGAFLPFKMVGKKLTVLKTSHPKKESSRLRLQGGHFLRACSASLGGSVSRYLCRKPSSITQNTLGAPVKICCQVFPRDKLSKTHRERSLKGENGNMLLNHVMA